MTHPGPNDQTRTGEARSADDDWWGEGLQVELFHANTERKPGDRNLVAWGFDVHPHVFFISGVLVAVFIALTLLLGEQAATAFGAVQSAITAYASWFYILAANVFVLFVVAIALSKYGDIRIGGVHAETEFSTFAWIAMLFSAGMGIGLMFWSVAEPVIHYDTPPGFFGAASQTPAAADGALAFTFYHWGLHPWAIYGLVALGLAFFSFNRGLPLTFRSIFWPVLGERIYGWPGHLIDVLSVLATLFGLSTSLGLGVQQVNAGLTFLSATYLPVTVPSATWVQVVLIAVITAMATLSVVAGLDGGVRRLSELNVKIMLSLLGFMLLVGPTVFILESYAQGLGTYVGNLAPMSLWTEAFEGSDWQGAWTLFYWGWWISWSPFVGMFIARISKGRTVRQLVLGVLLLPSMFSFFWMSTFGGSALFVELNTGGTMVEAVSADVSTAMFELFQFYPLAGLTSLVGVVLVVTFFVTSSDSGSLVVDHLTSGGKHDAPVNQRIFWAVTEGAVAAVLLLGGGLAALQTAAITAGLPFAVILLCMCYTVWIGLRTEYDILQSEEFAEWMERLAEEGAIEVEVDRSELVGEVSPGDD